MENNWGDFSNVAFFCLCAICLQVKGKGAWPKWLNGKYASAPNWIAIIVQYVKKAVGGRGPQDREREVGILGEGGSKPLPPEFLGILLLRKHVVP